MQPFTVTQNATHSNLSTVWCCKISGREISNINEALRQNQQQEPRVNTGKDFYPPAVFTQLKTTGSHSRVSSCIFTN
jgi:hypothetical protein